MVFAMQELILYVILGVVIAIAYSIRRLYSMEVKLVQIDQNIEDLLRKHKSRRK